jgi:hypothetical protein
MSASRRKFRLGRTKGATLSLHHSISGFVGRRFALMTVLGSGVLSLLLACKGKVEVTDLCSTVTCGEHAKCGSQTGECVCDAVNRPGFPGGSIC